MPPRHGYHLDGQSHPAFAGRGLGPLATLETAARPECKLSTAPLARYLRRAGLDRYPTLLPKQGEYETLVFMVALLACRARVASG